MMAATPYHVVLEPDGVVSHYSAEAIASNGPVMSASRSAAPRPAIQLRRHGRLASNYAAMTSVCCFGFEPPQPKRCTCGSRIPHSLAESKIAATLRGA